MKSPLLLLLLLAVPASGQTDGSNTVDSTSPAQASPTTVRSVSAARLQGEITLDGRLDEAAWQEAAVAGDFTQSYPDPGAAPTERTEARILYDDATLYVGVRAFDQHPDSIAAQLARRDASGIYSDWIHVIIDSYHDRRTGFRFSVNPRGVEKDVLHTNDNREDVDWDVIWDVATSVDSLGWTAEYRIPLSQIRFNPAAPDAERVWGLQIQRDIARREERDSWSPWVRTDPGYVSRFGDLTGLVGIPVPRRLEIQPYVSASVTRAPNEPGNPFFDENDATGKVGADLKYGLPLGLTLTGTINPDFGQVEVDPAVVNLSAFETFFSEKRPFFVEGADIFEFGEIRTNNNYNFEEYFYTRRIGRSPQRAVGGPGVTFVDAPAQTTILGAAKVSGKAGPWTVGVLDAVTAEEEAHYLTPDGDELSTPVEPLTNYFVGRLRRDLRGGNTVVGGMVNATNRDMGDTIFDGVLRSRALFGGLDFEHFWNDRSWSLTGYVAGSRVDGSDDVIAATQRSSARYFQRPDADYVELDTTRTSLSGHMAEVAVQKSGSWDFSAGYKQSSPGFEINDLGFQSRTDYRALSGFLGRRLDEPAGIFRNRGLYAYNNYAWNFGGDNVFQGYGGGAFATFQNLWRAELGVNYAPEATNPTLTRGGPLALRPADWNINLNAGTDSRKRISFDGSLFYRDDESGEYDRSFGVGVDFRPSSSVRLRLSPRYSRGRETDQFVRAVSDPLATQTFGRRYVFADVEQTTVSMNTRLDWTFSPNLSLQLFAQPFVATGDFSDYKEFLRPRSFDFGVYGEDLGTVTQDADGGFTVDPDADGPADPFTFGERDFNFRSLRGNAVLRWEYRPGSTLFFVWQQQREGIEGVGTFDLGRDVGEIFTAPSTNVFLIKATYWLGR